MLFGAYRDPARSLLPHPTLLLCISASTSSPPHPIVDLWGRVWLPPTIGGFAFISFPLIGHLAFSCLSYGRSLIQFWRGSPPQWRPPVFLAQRNQKLADLHDQVMVLFGNWLAEFVAKALHEMVGLKPGLEIERERESCVE